MDTDENQLPRSWGERRLVWEDLVRDGWGWVRAPSAAISGDPTALICEIIGPKPLVRLDVEEIRVRPGSHTFVGSAKEAALHTDHAAVFPAHLQVLACVHQAETGGDSLLLDTWAVANAIAADDTELFKRLFEQLRPFIYVDGVTVRPTISWRYGSLLYTKPPFDYPGDPLATTLQRRLDAAPKQQLRLTPGDVLVVDNHRMLHGRSAFTGHRHLRRILAWLTDGLPAPPNLVEPAKAVAERLAVMDLKLSPWQSSLIAPEVRSDRSWTRLGAVIAALNGEHSATIAERHNTSPREVRVWVERAVGGALNALAMPDDHDPRWIEAELVRSLRDTPVRDPDAERWCDASARASR